jgi:hypothetical protein
MKRTLLDMTQAILSTIDGDAVTSISDTVESLQVANQIRSAYFELIDEQQLPANHQIMALEALSDTKRPHVLRLPDNVSRIVFFKYNVQDNAEEATDYKDIEYLTPEEFIEEANKKDSLDTANNFLWIPTGQPNLRITIGKTAFPTHYTTFDDELLVFDSYNSSVESTMQASRTQAYCEIRPVFLMEDAFIPDLPENLFTLLYSTAENRCYYNFKQAVNALGNRSEGRSRVRAQRNKYRLDRDQNKWEQFPDYGRRR